MTTPRPKAKAPKIKPGGREAAKERVAAAQTVFHVSAAGTDLVFTVAPNNLPVRLRRELRNEIGKSVRQFLGDEGVPDIDTIVVLWWAARRVTGERVSYLDCEFEWDEKYSDVAYDDITVRQILETDDDPNPPGQPTS